MTLMSRIIFILVFFNCNFYRGFDSVLCLISCEQLLAEREEGLLPSLGILFLFTNRKEYSYHGVKLEQGFHHSKNRVKNYDTGKAIILMELKEKVQSWKFWELSHIFRISKWAAFIIFRLRLNFSSIGSLASSFGACHNFISAGIALPRVTWLFHLCPFFMQPDSVSILVCFPSIDMS